jgi:hypothetical protein
MPVDLAETNPEGKSQQIGNMILFCFNNVISFVKKKQRLMKLKKKKPSKQQIRPGKGSGQTCFENWRKYATITKDFVNTVHWVYFILYSF